MLYPIMPLTKQLYAQFILYNETDYYLQYLGNKIEYLEAKKQKQRLRAKQGNDKETYQYKA